MSTVLQDQDTLHKLLGRLRGQESRLLREVLARDFNTHLFIKANYDATFREVNEKDIQAVFERFDLSTRSMQALAVDYAPKQQGNGAGSRARTVGVDTLQREFEQGVADGEISLR